MEKLILRSFLIVTTLTTLVSCGGEISSDPTGIDAYAITHDQFSEKTQDTLSGIGVVRFITPLSSTEQTLKLRGSLDLITGSSIIAYFYSDSLNLTNNSGVEVQFIRSGAAVEGKIVVRSSVSNMATGRLAFYVPSNLDVIVQVRSITNSSTRVLIWRRDAVTYTVAQADINTTNNSHITPMLPNYGGLGNYAGLGIQNATVTAAQISTATVQ